MGRSLDTSIGMVVGWGRVMVPVALAVLGSCCLRGEPKADGDVEDGSRSYLWVGGLMIAMGGCGLLHLMYGRPGLDARTDELVDAGGLLGVAPVGPSPRASRPGVPA